MTRMEDQGSWVMTRMENVFGSGMRPHMRTLHEAMFVWLVTHDMGCNKGHTCMFFFSRARPRTHNEARCIRNHRTLACVPFSDPQCFSLRYLPKMANRKSLDVGKVGRLSCCTQIIVRHLARQRPGWWMRRPTAKSQTCLSGSQLSFCCFEELAGLYIRLWLAWPDRSSYTHPRKETRWRPSNGTKEYQATLKCPQGDAAAKDCYAAQIDTE